MANVILGLIKHTFQHINNEMFMTLYKATIVEHTTPFWSPYLKKDIKKLEGVQHHATKLVTVRIAVLRMPTLEYRTARVNMTQVYKLMTGFNDVNTESVFTINHLCSKI